MPSLGGACEDGLTQDDAEARARCDCSECPGCAICGACPMHTRRLEPGDAYEVPWDGRYWTRSETSCGHVQGCEWGRFTGPGYLTAKVTFSASGDDAQIGAPLVAGTQFLHPPADPVVIEIR